MSKSIYEEATDKNIITKQVVINTPTSARLLPITADKKVIDEIQQALNELKRLKKFKETFDNYELLKKQGFISYENWQECEKELTELKRDVARFIELTFSDDINSNDWQEFLSLKDKLLKVGKENNNVKK